MKLTWTHPRRHEWALIVGNVPIASDESMAGLEGYRYWSMVGLDRDAGERLVGLMVLGDLALRLQQLPERRKA